MYVYQPGETRFAEAMLEAQAQMVGDYGEALWAGLFEGVIDFVITDHSPCTPQLKLPNEGDFQRAWGGIASLSLGLSAIWTEASRRGASLERIARWMSEGPARFAGLALKAHPDSDTNATTRRPSGPPRGFCHGSHSSGGRQ